MELNEQLFISDLKQLSLVNPQELRINIRFSYVAINPHLEVFLKVQILCFDVYVCFKSHMQRTIEAVYKVLVSF